MRGSRDPADITGIAFGHGPNTSDSRDQRETVGQGSGRGHFWQQTSTPPHTIHTLLCASCVYSIFIPIIIFFMCKQHYPCEVDTDKN